MRNVGGSSLCTALSHTIFLKTHGNIQNIMVASLWTFCCHIAKPKLDAFLTFSVFSTLFHHLSVTCCSANHSNFSH